MLQNKSAKTVKLCGMDTFKNVIDQLWGSRSETTGAQLALIASWALGAVALGFHSLGGGGGGWVGVLEEEGD